ncbi:MAG: DUF423 domain-containing protein [Nitrospinae bacterium]|nr:DUF423 domain-containing protein [Nitrospinota bacterium]
MQPWIPLGAILGGLSVMFGAFGAHSLTARLTEQKLAAFHTATQYQFFHSLALVMVGILAIQLGEPFAKKLKLAGSLFAAGIALFCGSIYILTLGGPRFFGPVTPLGGLSFMAGWFTLAYAFLKKQ